MEKEITMGELAEIAKKVHELNEARIVINISGVGEPEVLLTEEGFKALFPEGVEPESKIGADGDRWNMYEVRVDGVRWVCWERENV